MNRTLVTSSVLKGVGYNTESRTLEIEFEDESLYQYFNVPSTTYEGLMTAKSHEAYMNSTIQKARYRYVCVKEANPMLGLKILPSMKGLPNR